MNKKKNLLEDVLRGRAGRTVREARERILRNVKDVYGIDDHPGPDEAALKLHDAVFAAVRDALGLSITFTYAEAREAIEKLKLEGDAARADCDMLERLVDRLDTIAIRGGLGALDDSWGEAATALLDQLALDAIERAARGDHAPGDIVWRVPAGASAKESLALIDRVRALREALAAAVFSMGRERERAKQAEARVRELEEALAAGKKGGAR